MESCPGLYNSGFHVFPLKKGGKKPLTEHGLLDATMSPDKVNEYWNRWPEVNIGIVTNGLMVIDFDIKNGGLESKLKIEAKYGPLPRTRVTEQEEVSTGFTNNHQDRTLEILLNGLVIRV